MTDTTTIKRRRRTAREPKTTQSETQDNALEQHQEGKANAGLTPPKRSKIDQVLDLLNRRGGATLDEMVEATGWLPHTARAAMTGLKKKGYTIERTKVDGISPYAIVKPDNQ